MTITTSTLVKIAAWGGIIVSTTGFYLQTVLVDRVRGYDYYKKALKQLRSHRGAVFYLGEPIKDRRFKLSDTERNNCDGETARFSVPVSGPKDRGTYYFWAVKEDNEWYLQKAELELKSKPEERLVIVKEKAMSGIFGGTRREKFFFHNTLLCLVKALEGQKVTIDLRNDSYVCGTLSSVDGFMNITFTNAIYCNPRGEEFAFENMYLQARNIRYVHIPEHLNMIETMEKELRRGIRKPVPKPDRTKSRKVKKAMKQHMDIVASLDI